MLGGGPSAEAVPSLYSLAQRINALSRPGVVMADVTRFVQGAARSIDMMPDLDRPALAHLASILQFSTRFAQPEDSAILVRCSLPHLKNGLVRAEDTTIASILNSISKVVGIEPGIARMAGEAVEASKVLETGRIIAVITTMRALARLGYDDGGSQLFPKVRDLIMSRVDDLCPEDLCSALQIFTGGREHVVGDELLHRVKMRLLASADIQGSTAASLLYSLSMYGVSDCRLVIDKLAHAVVLSGDSLEVVLVDVDVVVVYNERQVDSITLAVTALASFEATDTKLLLALVEPLKSRLNELRPRNVNAVVLAAAKMRFYDYSMLSHMTHCALNTLGLKEFTTVELGMLVQGLTKLKFGNNTLYVSLFTAITQRGGEASPIALSMALDAVHRKLNGIRKSRGPSHHVSNQLRQTGPLIDSMTALYNMAFEWLQKAQLTSVRTRELTQISSCLLGMTELCDGKPLVEVITSCFLVLSRRLIDGSSLSGDDRRFIAHAWRTCRAQLPEVSTALPDKDRGALDVVERAYPSATPKAGQQIMRRSVMRRDLEAALTRGPIRAQPPTERKAPGVVDGLFDSI